MGVLVYFMECLAAFSQKQSRGHERTPMFLKGFIFDLLRQTEELF